MRSVQFAGPKQWNNLCRGVCVVEGDVCVYIYMGCEYYVNRCSFVDFSIKSSL